MPSSYHLIYLLLLIPACICHKQVEDFTYSDFATVQYHDQPTNIIISPNKSTLENFEFQKTWQIKQILQAQYFKHESIPQIRNIDGQILFIKQKMARFLKLSNKAELILQNIKQLPSMKNTDFSVITEQELNALDNQEKVIQTINEKINLKSSEIQKILHQLMIGQQNFFFKQAALNFEKKALASKTQLLNFLLDETQSASKIDHDKKLNQYFNSLEKIFDTENKLIDQIDTLLKNHNELKTLKPKVTSLTSQLKAQELTLAQKQDCQQQFKRIKSKQASDRQVVKLIEALKQKKFEFNEPNKYCQGVVSKLVQRIKIILLGYDYLYKCKQSLEQVKSKHRKIASELNAAQKRLDELQKSRGIQYFKLNFENNRKLIALKLQELKILPLDRFYHSPKQIRDQISLSQNRISQIDSVLANLPKKQIVDLTQIDKILQEKVSQAKALKKIYCKQNQKYVQNSKSIEDRLSKLEQQQEHNNWVKTIQLQKYLQLQTVKKQMKQVKQEILQELEK